MAVVLPMVNSRKFHVSTINKKKPTNLIIKMNLCYGKIGETWQNKTNMKKKERKQKEKEMNRDIMRGIDGYLKIT